MMTSRRSAQNMLVACLGLVLIAGGCAEHVGGGTYPSLEDLHQAILRAGIRCESYTLSPDWPQSAARCETGYGKALLLRVKGGEATRAELAAARAGERERMQDYASATNRDGPPHLQVILMGENWMIWTAGVESDSLARQLQEELGGTVYRFDP
jgi:hypothetical protein